MARTGRPKGYPKSGGRQVGTQNYITQATAKAVRDAISLTTGHTTGLTPLQMMLVIADVRFQMADYAGALTAASLAAPYIHPKLTSVEMHVHNDDERKTDAQIEAEIRELQAKLTATGTWTVN